MFVWVNINRYWHWISSIVKWENRKKSTKINNQWSKIHKLIVNIMCGFFVIKKKKTQAKHSQWQTQTDSRCINLWKGMEMLSVFRFSFLDIWFSHSHMCACIGVHLNWTLISPSLLFSFKPSAVLILLVSSTFACH